jgi:hypothetical protein
MRLPHKPTDKIKRYLLGDLPAEELIALEDEYLFDNGKYEQICQVEDDLIESYAQGSLSPSDREFFDNAYLKNPQRERHVKFQKAFAKALREERSTRSSVGTRQLSSWPSRLNGLFYGCSITLKLAFASTMFLFAVSVIWFIVETARIQTRLADVQKSVEAQQQLVKTQAQRITGIGAQSKILADDHKNLQNQIHSIKAKESRRSPHSFVIFPLAINIVRDSEQQSQTLTILSNIQDVGLLIRLPEMDYLSYQVQLLTVEGEIIFSRRGVKFRSAQSGKSLLVQIPAHKFKSGDSIVSVSGITSTRDVEIIGKAIIKVNQLGREEPN